MTYRPFDLTGKVALVTGGNGGIGLGMAETLAAVSSDVVIWGTNAGRNAAACQTLEAHGGRVTVAQVDVSNEAAVIAGIGDAVRRFARLDFVAANAGIGRRSASFADISLRPRAESRDRAPLVCHHPSVRRWQWPYRTRHRRDRPPDAGTAAARSDPLDGSRDGQGGRRCGLDGASDLKGARPQSAPLAQLQAGERPGVRREAHRDRRPLCHSAGPCGGAVVRREVANPGARPHPARPADEEGPRRHHDRQRRRGGVALLDGPVQPQIAGPGRSSDGRRRQKPTGPSFEAAAKAFTREFELIRLGERNAGYVASKSDHIRVHLLPFFGDTALEDTTAGKEQEYRLHRQTSRVDPKTGKAKKPARATLHGEIVTLRQILKTANRKGWIAALLDRHGRSPRETRAAACARPSPASACRQSPRPRGSSRTGTLRPVGTAAG